MKVDLGRTFDVWCGLLVGVLATMGVAYAGVWLYAEAMLKLSEVPR